MRQHHGRESGLDAHRREEQHEADGGDDVRIQHRQVVDLVDGLPHHLLAFGQADGGDCADDGGNRCGDDRAQHGVPDGAHDGAVGEHALVPLQREAGEVGQRLGGVEAEEDDIQDRQIEECQDQDQIQAFPPGALLLHQSSASLLPLSSLRVTYMEIRMMIAMIRLMAEPKFQSPVVMK